jgi:hypothetical protein
MIINHIDVMMTNLISANIVSTSWLLLDGRTVLRTAISNSDARGCVTPTTRSRLRAGRVELFDGLKATGGSNQVGRQCHDAWATVSTPGLNRVIMVTTITA